MKLWHALVLAGVFLIGVGVGQMAPKKSEPMMILSMDKIQLDQHPEGYTVSLFVAPYKKANP